MARSARRRAAAAAAAARCSVLIVVAMIPIVAFMAFAIDVGMLTVAQTQLRDAADATALAGCRALNGNSANNNNYSGVAPAAQTALTANDIMGNSLQASQAHPEHRTVCLQLDGPAIPRELPQHPDLGQLEHGPGRRDARICTNSLGFGKIFNFTLPNFQATSTAAFRPRDICVILDFSGSMRFSSLLGTPYYGNRSCNNQDTVVPTFGQYSAG